MFMALWIQAPTSVRPTWPCAGGGTQIQLVGSITTQMKISIIPESSLILVLSQYLLFSEVTTDFHHYRF